MIHPVTSRMDKGGIGLLMGLSSTSEGHDAKVVTGAGTAG